MEPIPDRTSPAPVPDPAPGQPPSVPEPLRRPRSARREQAVADALRTLIRDTYADRFGAVPPPDATLDLALTVRVDPRGNWATEFTPALSDQINLRFDDLHPATETYRSGHVYCFRCESAACSHTRPARGTEVFQGYGPTGVPEWHDLTQALIEARDERVDRLYARHPQAVALVQMGHGLRQRQLSTFGRASRRHGVLGQVVCGYFLVPDRLAQAAGDRRLALTFQVVETRDAQGRLGLRLNSIAGLEPPDRLEELLTTDWAAWLFRAREIAGRRLEHLVQRARAAREQKRMDELDATLRRVPRILRELADSLERGQRQEQRRTRHVEQRRQDHRPVAMAVEDLRTVAADRIYVDEHRETLAVCGPQGRTHIFSPEGRHVTSLTLRPDAVAFRLKTRRWRPATPDEVQALRSRVQPAPAAGTGDS